jgi:hypothetical protein
MKRRYTIAAMALAAALLPAAARADTLLIPFWGVNFGGDSGKDFSNAVDAKRYNYGGSFAFMGAGVFGIEGDFSYSPDFFGKSDVGGSSVLTGTGNLMLGIPFGGQQGFGIRPYGVVGLGVMKSSADFEEVDENSFTWDFGGGIALFFGTHFGMRFDFRYFRTFDDVEIFGVEVVEDQPGKLDFTRSSIGFIFRF